jgi:hypothetical protein
MNSVLRRLFGVTGIGLSWALAWAVVFATIALVIGIIRPQDIDPGETPIVFVGIGFAVGFVSGSVFGVILALAEHHKSILELPPVRAGLWGLLAAGVWPLLTPVDDRMVYILCPLGAICASVSVAIARDALAGSEQSSLRSRISRLIASPLRAACASNGVT